MGEWISVKKCLPLDGSIVKVRWSILFSVTKEAMFTKNYFVHKGENITLWVHHWMPTESYEKQAGPP